MRSRAQCQPRRERGGANRHWREHIYIMLNKPGVCQRHGGQGRRPVVTELCAERDRARYFRAADDKYTVGLMLLTDDGELAHRLLAPSRHVDLQLIRWRVGAFRGRASTARERRLY